MKRLMPVIVGSSIIAVGLVVAGPLNPPAGPVASSYKTLSEVQPRTAINGVNTPGDADSVYRITAPGSYFLTGDILGAAGKSGIEIAVGSVSIDLSGFAILGTVSSLAGVTVYGANRPDIAVTNGSVRGWAGIGLDLTNALGPRIEGIAASANTGGGISAGPNAVIRSCTATSNGGVGILTSANAVIESCAARQSQYSGISVGLGSNVSHCSAVLNGNAGFRLDKGSTLADCTSGDNGNNGVFVDQGCTVSGCTIYSNGYDGIEAFSGCSILNNNIRNNGNPGSFSGIDLGSLTDYCLVVGNNVTGNGYGIRCEGFSNFIARNTCGGNVTNWYIEYGNDCLVVIAASCSDFYGNSGGTSPGSWDPNANYTH